MPESSADTAGQLQREGAQLRLHARYAEAERVLLRSLDLKHDCAASHLELALTYRIQRQLEDALDHLQLAVHFEPAFAAGWLELGITFAQLGRIDSAIDACRRAAALEPRNASAWRQLGALHKSAEDWTTAIDCYRTAAAC